mmetsp:Transcript_7416/g.12530  ORF Transcript_7416/g.12530 Transcript_7416/m.12530 type:complete len:86 (+) Transcript_7416:371-628(+)
MSLAYNATQPFKDQLVMKTFEFYSIVEDHDEQQLDSLIGLGLLSPEQPAQDGKMNFIDWLYGLDYIKRRMVSIYLMNYNGMDELA